MTEDELKAEHAALQREQADLEREYGLLAEEPSRVLLRQHARRLLDHIAVLHTLLATVRKG
jgi:hypothetical protein